MGDEDLAAWALYGLALGARYAGRADFLAGFKAPIADNVHLDSSAGACAASGLLLLSTLVAEGKRVALVEGDEGRARLSLYDTEGLSPGEARTRGDPRAQGPRLPPRLDGRAPSSAPGPTPGACPRCRACSSSSPAPAALRLLRNRGPSSILRPCTSTTSWRPTTPRESSATPSTT